MENQKETTAGLGAHDDVIDVAAYTKEGKKPPTGKRYKVLVGPHHLVFDQQYLTGNDIFQMAGITPPECHWLYQKLRGCDFEKIDLNEKVDLARPGIEHFVVKPTEVFHYFVDGEPETTDEKEMTPNEILAAAGLTPVKDYYLVMINADGSQTKFKDNPDTPIKMVCPAVKFVSAFRGEVTVS